VLSRQLSRPQVTTTGVGSGEEASREKFSPAHGIHPGAPAAPGGTQGTQGMPALSRDPFLVAAARALTASPAPVVLALPSHELTAGSSFVCLSVCLHQQGIHGAEELAVVSPRGPFFFRSLWRWSASWSSASRLPGAGSQGRDEPLPTDRNWQYAAWLGLGRGRARARGGFWRSGRLWGNKVLRHCRGVRDPSAPAGRVGQHKWPEIPTDSGRSPIYRCRYRPHIAIPKAGARRGVKIHTELTSMSWRQGAADGARGGRQNNTFSCPR
jgi:hypothetical protein